MSGTPITLALVTYNQAALLRRFLAAWRDHGSDRIPLLVVDDGSTDATPDVLRAAAHPRLAVERTPHVSIAHARNRALRAAATPWIAFSDTDCLLSREYFEVLAGVPGRFPRAAAVEGMVRPAPGPKPPFTHSLANAGGGFVTANMAYNIAAVMEAGGFDEAFGNYREDADLALTLLETGREIAFCPELAVEHPHLPRALRPALRGAYAAQARIFASEMRLYRKHPGGYARLRHHRDARSTLRAWMAKYFAAHCRQCFRFWFGKPRAAPESRRQALAATAEELLAAAVEQACILWIGMVKWREIARLRQP